jgi:hypothetical protein
MFLRESFDTQVWIGYLTGRRRELAQHGAVAGHAGKTAGAVGGERLAAAVEHDAVRRGGAHHRGEHTQGAVVERRGAEPGHRAVEVDVVARPVLGEPVLVEREPRRRGGARAHFVDDDSGGARFAREGHRPQFGLRHPPQLLLGCA